VEYLPSSTPENYKGITKLIQQAEGTNW
jgi:hypothetical protein